MRIFINTDVENYGLPRFFVKYLTEMGIREFNDDQPEIVFNIDSIDSKGFRKGKKLTLYLEGDEFMNKGSRIDRYPQSDLLYIIQPNYLKYYPSKAKVLKIGVAPDFHYPRNVKKEYDYVFIGRTRGNSVYDDRLNKLEELKKSKYTILVTDGTQETYCDLMSSGRIILNIMPKSGNEVCVNHRILEGMAMGCVMTDYHPYLDDFGLVKNVHYLPLDRFGDISDDEIQHIHEVGRKFVLENYSYPKAIDGILNDIYEWKKSTT